MSIDMVTAIDKDMAVINEDGTADYVDNDNTITVEASENEAIKTINTNASMVEDQDAEAIQRSLFGD